MKKHNNSVKIVFISVMFKILPFDRPDNMEAVTPPQTLKSLAILLSGMCIQILPLKITHSNCGKIANVRKSSAQNVPASIKMYEM